MVKLRLARFGKKHRPFYRLVAIDSRAKRNGMAIEYLGTYDPMQSPSKFEYDKEAVEKWLSEGAQPSDTVHRLLSKDGVTEKLEANFKKAPGRKSQERAEKKAEASAEEKTEEAAE